MSGFVKRLVLWLVIALPIGAGSGAAISVFWTEDGRVDMATAAFNGTVIGLWLAFFGAIAAAFTNYFGQAQLKRVGGSEFITGMTIVIGLIGIGLIGLRYS